MMTIQLPEIVGVTISPNPVLAGQRFLISVQVNLKDVTLYPKVRYTGERYTGEQW